MASGIETKLVQRRLMVPFTLGLITVVAVFAFLYIKSQDQHHDQIKKNLLDVSIRTFNNSLKDQSDSLSALASVLSFDKKLQHALKEQNRQQLLH